MRYIDHIGRLSKIADNDKDKVNAQAMLEELQADNQTLIAALKRAKELADDARDNVSSSVIDQWTDEAEQRVWFLREALM